MKNAIPISAEIVKLAQLRSRACGCDVRQETARQLAQEAILNLDPELDLLIEEDRAYSQDDRLLGTFELNDIVVNGARFDVRVQGEDGRVSIPRFLVGTSYMSLGTLAVAFHPDRTASIVGFIPRSDWDLQDKHASQKEERLIFRVPSNGFSLDSIAEIIKSYVPQEFKFSRVPIHASEIAQFCGHKQEMKISKQRDFVNAVLNNESSWGDLQHGISKSFVKRTLSHASVWNQKVDQLSDKLQGKFKRLNREEIKSQVAKLGEQLGGQINTSHYRKQLLVRLTHEELSRCLPQTQLAKASHLVEQILQGRSLIDVIKDTVKNNTAVDLALSIKRQRQKLANFIEASSDEITFAVRQLALQPVYATHSKGPEAVESVNEALNLLDAGELAESLKELEAELS